MRERIEDLGRILVLLEKIEEHEVFNFLHMGRNKDFPEHFLTRSTPQQYDDLHKIIYGLSYIHEELANLILIARGHDNLNDPPL